MALQYNVYLFQSVHLNRLLYFRRNLSNEMRCHYEVMGLPSNATNEEIKKQYKKLALKWHPDRNHGQEEVATQAFKEISAAYTVLSDAHERKWYDDHRDAILRGGDGTADDDEERVGQEVNIWSYFNTSCFQDFDDKPKGFFTVYRNLFEDLLDQERLKSSDTTSKNLFYPSFGSSTSDSKDVLQFYAHWENFVTKLNFAWEDKYNVLDAENRQVRRAMEKENIKLRETAKKEFLHEVHSLVMYVKKRDPRVIAIELEKSRLKQEEEQRRLQAKEQEMKRRKELKSQYQQAYSLNEEEQLHREQERSKAFLLADQDSEDEEDVDIHEPVDDIRDDERNIAEEQLQARIASLHLQRQSGDGDVANNGGKCLTTNDFNEEGDFDNNEEEDKSDEAASYFNCEICSKSFKTEAQLNQHLASKVHRKKVQEAQKKDKKSKK